MRPYRFHPDARAEFHQSARYYELQEPGLGRRFVEAVRTATHRVRERPAIYREIEPEVRQCRIVSFPYGIIFQETEGQIEILAVMHLHRKPGYWQERRTGV